MQKKAVHFRLTCSKRFPYWKSRNGDTFHFLLFLLSALFFVEAKH